MTVTQLIKQLQKIAEKRPRAEVLAETDTFVSPDYSHGVVNSVVTEVLPMSDGDGFTIENKDGTEHCRFCVVLKG